MTWAGRVLSTPIKSRGRGLDGWDRRNDRIWTMKNKRRPSDPGAEAPGGDDAATRVQVGLERWAALSEGDDAAARAAFAPVVAEEILRLPGDPKSGERAALVERRVAGLPRSSFRTYGRDPSCGHAGGCGLGRGSSGVECISRG